MVPVGMERDMFPQDSFRFSARCLAINPAAPIHQIDPFGGARLTAALSDLARVTLAVSPGFSSPGFSVPVADSTWLADFLRLAFGRVALR